eukprot:88712-Rhodomonas_salina.2
MSERADVVALAPLLGLSTPIPIAAQPDVRMTCSFGCLGALSGAFVQHISSSIAASVTCPRTFMSIARSVYGAVGGGFPVPDESDAAVCIASILSHALAMQCPVLIYNTLLPGGRVRLERARDIACAALPVERAAEALREHVNVIRAAGNVLRARYAMSGTGIANGGTTYQRAMRRSVLTYRMVVPPYAP